MLEYAYIALINIIFTIHFFLYSTLHDVQSYSITNISLPMIHDDFMVNDPLEESLSLVD